MNARVKLHLELISIGNRLHGLNRRLRHYLFNRVADPADPVYRELRDELQALRGVAALFELEWRYS